MNIVIRLILVSQFVFLSTVGQIPHSKTFISKNGFCTTTLFLDSLGNFYRESGCEGRSHISFGYYTLKGEKIDFAFQSFDSLSAIHAIKPGRSSGDSLITITFLSRQGQPIPNNYFSVDAIEASGKFYKTFKLTGNGEVIVDFKKYKELRLDYLEHIYNKKVIISITGNDIVTMLNLPKLFFYYPKPIPGKGKNFSLIMKKDGLYDSEGKGRLFSPDK